MTVHSVQVVFGDLNPKVGEATEKELGEKYGKDKVQFIPFDVTNGPEFEGKMDLLSSFIHSFNQTPHPSPPPPPPPCPSTHAHSPLSILSLFYVSNDFRRKLTMLSDFFVQPASLLFLIAGEMAADINKVFRLEIVKIE